MTFRSFALALYLCSAASGQTQDKPAGESEPKVVVPDADAKSTVSSVLRADAPYHPLTARERWRFYLRETYLSPRPYIRATVSGLVQQWEDEPSEWEQGMRGYARRTTSAWGLFTLADTYEAAGAAALGHEVRYVRCRCSGFGPRFRYAVASSLLARDRNGRIVPAVARIGGEFAAGYTAKLWLPEGYQSDSRIARNVLVQTGFKGIVNTLKEFTPELRRVFRRK